MLLLLTCLFDTALNNNIGIMFLNLFSQIRKNKHNDVHHGVLTYGKETVNYVRRRDLEIDPLKGLNCIELKLNQNKNVLLVFLPHALK